MRVTIITMLAIALTACQPKQPQSQNNWGQAMPVDTALPSKQMVVDWDEYTGRFEASKRVEVRPRVGGFISKVLFKDGEMVAAGQALYELDKRPFEIAVNSARANLTQAKKELERANNLRRNNAISQEELDARATELESAQAAFDQAALNLEFSTVVAPISGRIDRTYVDAGNLITGGAAANTTLTTIVTLEPIFFYFNASERDVLKYVRRNINQPDTAGRDKPWPVSVKLQDEADYVHQGSINFVGNALDQGAGTLEIRAEFGNPDQFLQPGFFGRLRIAPTNPYQALVLPQEVIISQGQKKFVYTVSPDNSAVPKYIELGNLTEDGLQIIKSGIEEDDQIIISNLQMLRPGSKVTPSATADSTGE